MANTLLLAALTIMSLYTLDTAANPTCKSLVYDACMAADKCEEKKACDCDDESDDWKKSKEECIDDCDGEKWSKSKCDSACTADAKHRWSSTSDFKCSCGDTVHCVDEDYDEAKSSSIDGATPKALSPWAGASAGLLLLLLAPRP